MISAQGEAHAASISSMLIDIPQYPAIYMVLHLLLPLLLPPYVCWFSGGDAQHREAHAAFTASLEKVVSAHRGRSASRHESFTRRPPRFAAVLLLATRAWFLMGKCV